MHQEQGLDLRDTRCLENPVAAAIAELSNFFGSTMCLMELLEDGPRSDRHLDCTVEQPQISGAGQCSCPTHGTLSYLVPSLTKHMHGLGFGQLSVESYANVLCKSTSGLGYASKLLSIGINSDLSMSDVRESCSDVNK